MKAHHVNYCLVNIGGQWHVGRSDSTIAEVTSVDVPNDAKVEELAAVLAHSLRDQGWRGQPLAVALDSKDCLSATIDWNGPLRDRRRRQMEFALEEFLPLSAEELVVDFVTLGQHALGIGVEAARLRPLIDQLHVNGVEPRLIAPAAMLASQFVARQWPNKQAALLVLTQGNQCDICQIDSSRRIGAWNSMATDWNAIRPAVTWHLLTSSQTGEITLANADRELHDDMVAEFGAVAPAPAQVENHTVLELVVLAAAEVLAGRHEPCVQLARGSLGTPNPFTGLRASAAFAACGTMLLMASLIFLCFYRANQYTSQVAALAQQQQDLYSEVFPGQSAPPGVLSRFESEARKLRGTTGRKADMPLRASTLGTLRSVLRAMPKSFRFRCIEVVVEQQRVDLKGETRSHGDADRWLSRLAAHGFIVDPPRTENMPEKGVAVTLHAQQREIENESP